MSKWRLWFNHRLKPRNKADQTKHILMRHLRALHCYSPKQITAYLNGFFYQEFINDMDSFGKVDCIAHYGEHSCPLYSAANDAEANDGCGNCQFYVTKDLFDRCLKWNKSFFVFYQQLKKDLALEYDYISKTEEKEENDPSIN